MKLTAIIFDMDGVIIDSEWLWAEIEGEFFTRHGGSLTDDIRKELMGKNYNAVAATFRRVLHLELDDDALLQPLLQTFRDRFHEVHLNPGYRELMDQITTAGYRRALASGAGDRTIALVFDTFHLHHDFEVVVSGNAVSNPKPFPDVFLKAAALLAVSPENCMVIEDSPNGVMAAKRAGMKCIAIPNPALAYHASFQQADRIRQNLSDITLNDFQL